MSGKGSKRRPGKSGAFEKGYEAIDWSKGRPASKVKPRLLMSITDYTAQETWRIPSIEELTRNLNTPTI